jgi:hypothetical protein
VFIQTVGDQYYGLNLAVGQPASPVKVKIAAAFEISLFLLHNNLPHFCQYYAPAAHGRQVTPNRAPPKP